MPVVITTPLDRISAVGEHVNIEEVYQRYQNVVYKFFDTQGVHIIYTMIENWLYQFMIYVYYDEKIIGHRKYGVLFTENKVKFMYQKDGDELCVEECFPVFPTDKNEEVINKYMPNVICGFVNNTLKEIKNESNEQ